MEIREFQIQSNNGQKVSFSSVGASIMKWIIPNHIEEDLDIVLGFNSPKQYQNAHPCFGSIIGRFANRIAEGKFSMNGETIDLAKNSDENLLHSGQSNYAFKVWSVVNQSSDKIEFELISKDQAGGFPGTLKINVEYRFDSNNALVIEYKAICDKDTIVNLTNHTYFNLNGESSGEVLNHKFQIHASHFLPTNSESIPTGVIQSVNGSIMDLNIPQKLNKSNFETHDLFKHCRAYDHNYVLKNNGNIELAASVYSEKTGLLLECFTNKPGLQFYLGNFLDAIKSKKGLVYAKHHGFCLESQFFPDSPNHSHFPNTVIKAGESYNWSTSYKVSSE